jgi:uncharacterized repeat protein (TIGR03803 family)
MNTQPKINKSGTALSQLLQVTKARIGILLALLIMSASAMGQSFSVLHRLDGATQGSGPNGKLVLSGGKLYGTAIAGGSHDDGTIFSLKKDGSGFTLLHEFSGSDGVEIVDGLTISSNGTTLYGVAYWGGNAQNWGTMFKINTDGSGFTTLHTFGTGEGHNPAGPLVLNGTNLFGTTYFGGANNWGTVFKINLDGSGYTTLHSFTSSDNLPASSVILSGTTLYGTTSGELGVNPGIVFKLQTDGSGFTTLHTFDGNYGSDAGLVLSGTTLYGTTLYGGTYGYGNVFKLNTDGSGFTTLHSFSNSGTDGSILVAPLVLVGNVLYGLAGAGGDYSTGTIFRLNTDGSGFTTLYKDLDIGYNPGSGGLITDGVLLYGVMVDDLYSQGTVFVSSGHLIDIDFDAGSGPSAKSGFAATGITANDFWNFYTRDDGNGGWRTSGNIPNLSYVDTSSSGVGLTVNNAPGAWNDGSSDPMYGGYIYPFSGNATFTLTNLPIGIYNIYLYSVDGNYDLTVGGNFIGNVTTSDMPLSSDPPNWQNGVQYGLFSNVSVSSGQSVVVTVKPGTAGYAILAGMQIERVEPNLIDIDFDAGSGPSAKSGFAATGQNSSDFWNFYTRDDGNGGWRTSGAIPNLAYVDQKASNVGLTVDNAPGAWNDGSSDPMYGGYIYPFSGNATFTITNLPAGNYNIYLYSVDGNYDLTVGGSYIGNVTTSDMPLSSDPPNWQNGVQYGLFSNVSVSSGQSVVVTVKPGVGGYAILAGMQIEPIQP